MMTSTKIEKTPGIGNSHICIIYDDNEGLDLVRVLADEFKLSLSTESSISTLAETTPVEQYTVIVDHTSNSFLLDLDERKLGVLKSIFAQAKGILWITFDSPGNSTNAAAGAVSGILRTLRSENEGMNYVTCDVETADFSNMEIAQAISKVFAKILKKPSANSPMKDFEYALRNGRIMIPRVIEDRLANRGIMTQPLKREPEEQPLWQEDSCLCLDMGSLGLLDTFHFIHSEKLSNEINRDEVEIEVKTVGLNFHDLMVATGQLPDPNGYGVECAGIITKLGQATHDLSIGDRVCAIAPSSFASSVRASQNLVSIMPDTMTFETGASIPSVFTASYYCLHHAAYLKKNESVLIHSAAGGVGQACIKMAQLMGADIFVTVGSSAKADFLESTFGLPRSHIMNSRTLEFRHQIMILTKGKGIDVIINSLAGEALRESWRCLAMFGRFIELGKKDAVENTRLDMAPFEKSASFISVGWDHFGYHQPDVVGRTLKKVIEMFSNNTLTPLKPITVFPMSAIESAFRFMASGNHMGKIVVAAEKNCSVSVRKACELLRCC